MKLFTKATLLLRALVLSVPSVVTATEIRYRHDVLVVGAA